MDGQQKIPHNGRSQEEAVIKQNADEEKKSVWLFDLLDLIGMNEEYRSKTQRAYRMLEIIYTFLDPDFSWYLVGSRAEGIFAPDRRFDQDSIVCDDSLPVVEKIADASQDEAALLIIRDVHTHAGYVKLQLVIKGEPHAPCTFPILCEYCRTNRYKRDRKGRMVLTDIREEQNALAWFKFKNDRPAFKTVDMQHDLVQSLRCKTWPSPAQEWLCRHRLYGWPPEDTIQKVKSFGFFVIKKSHPLSSEIDLEWSISLTLQERKLMASLSDTQHKCYCILKLFNRDIIKKDNITSYHWKTCLFYVLEENPNYIWQKERLYISVNLCIKQMLKWVQIGFCPNYFIPMDNLFDDKLNESQKSILENVLNNILDTGFDSLLDVSSYNICDYVRSRNAEKLPEWLLTESRRVYKRTLMRLDIRWTKDARFHYDKHITEHYYKFENIYTLIKFIWLTLDRIKRYDVGTEYTSEETKNSLSVLIPYLYECLASYISAMAIHHPNLQVRNFLLFGSFICFQKGDLLGRLKLISVLYAIGLYTDSEWFLDLENEKEIKDNQSLCSCRFISRKENLITTWTKLDTIPSQSKRCSCVTFLPFELSIIPDAMKYEMFKHLGVFIQHKEKQDNTTRWLYKAVVDYNIYFFLLKYLIKRKLKKFQASQEGIKNILKLLDLKHVIHSDVAFNVLAWIYNTHSNAPKALLYLSGSWHQQNPFELLFTTLTNEMKQKSYQCNAAKLHALVLLYNLWFEKKPSSVHFCFKCLFVSKCELKKCSKCKISTYCSRQCQEIHWKIHKLVCKIARRYKST